MSRFSLLAAAAALFLAIVAHTHAVAAVPFTCDADSDNNGLVRILDLAFVLNHRDSRNDRSGDGHIDCFDLENPTETPVSDPTLQANASPTSEADTWAATPTEMETLTPTQTFTPSATPTLTNSVIPTPTSTNSATPIETETPSPTETISLGTTPSATPSFTDTDTATARPLISTSTPTPIATEMPTPTLTPTDSPTLVLPTTTQTATATAVPAPTPTPAQGTRDVYAWPCASSSIWNMPIGSAASYVAAGIQNANGWNNGDMTTDAEFIGLNPGDPLKSLNGSSVHVPPGMSHGGGWNGTSAFLSSDGHTVLQGQPLLLSAGGDPAWQYNAPTVDIKGDCIRGAHGGSGLSSFGGALRKGELVSSQALHHALKINLYARRFLSCANGGYRWPAVHADAYMNCSTYGGSVSQMRMGSLVALRPTEGCTSYGSVRARKICQALQDYGAYVVDDTTWDVHTIDIESGAEFSDGGSFHRDLQAMFTHLAVIDNNGPSSIGGGGTPRQPPAPPSR